MFIFAFSFPRTVPSTALTILFICTFQYNVFMFLYTAVHTGRHAKQLSNNDQKAGEKIVDFFYSKMRGQKCPIQYMEYCCVKPGSPDTGKLKGSRESQFPSVIGDLHFHDAACASSVNRISACSQNAAFYTADIFDTRVLGSI